MLSILACSLTLLFFSAQSTSAQIIYPGIFVNFTCKVTGPFIQVNGSEVTTDRGVGGYVADLLDMGIEAKNVIVTSQLSFIPTVCVNGSSPQLGNRSTTTFTMTCQNFQVENGQFITIHHFNFTLKYQSRLPPPANVSMSDNNMLEWSRPPCVTNSSSDTYSIEVNHTLEFTYTIYITRSNTIDGTVTIIITAVSTTSYDLSNELQPCSEYTIEVCACNSETMCNDNERSPPINFTMPVLGCPLNPSTSVSEDTATTIPSSVTEREDSIKQTSRRIKIIAGTCTSGVAVILIGNTVIIIFIVKKKTSKRSRKRNVAVAHVSEVNVEEFTAKENMYEESKPSPDSPPPTYEYTTITQPSIAIGNLHHTPHQNPNNGQQSSSLIYADLALQTGSTAPLPADSQTYVTVQTKSA